MIALQEELDWAVYGEYGLLSPQEMTRVIPDPGATVPPIGPGERAFELVLARKVAAGEAAESWFTRDDAAESTRNNALPITEIPSHWPAEYGAVVRARIDAIGSHPAIALIERPEYKRRWSSPSWETLERETLRTWLLDRCEDTRLWFVPGEDGGVRPRARTVRQIADALGGDADVSSVAALYAADHLSTPDAPLAAVLTDVLATEHVPYLAALRHEESGLRKRAQWEQVWALQRKEDSTGQALGIAVPPRFAARDFRRGSYWALRGRLDVPRERFISYPEADQADDGALMLGWAGWNVIDRTRVLLDLARDAQQHRDGAAARVTPLLAGIQELLPWVRQWEPPEGSGTEGSHADTVLQKFVELRAAYGLSFHDLLSWRPMKKAPRRR
jgi:hypothetical protein